MGSDGSRWLLSMVRRQRLQHNCCSNQASFSSLIRHQEQQQQPKYQNQSQIQQQGKSHGYCCNRIVTRRLIHNYAIPFDATRFTDASSLVRFHLDDINTTPCLQNFVEQKQRKNHKTMINNKTRGDDENHDNNDDDDMYNKIQGKIGTITINSPKTYNALTIEIGIEFQALLQRLTYELNYQKPSQNQPLQQTEQNHDSNETICTLTSLNAHNVQVLIIKGAGEAFSAGGNLSWLHSLHDNTVLQNYDLMMQFYQYYAQSIQSLPIPIIAAINGPAMGAGACLALLCDLRTGSTPHTKLGMHFTKLGIHSGLGATYLLQNSIRSSTIVNEILLLGKILNGSECYQYHVINKLHENDATIPAYELAYDMISHTHPVASRMILQSLRMSQFSGLHQALQRDAMCQSICYGQSDWGEGLYAIAQKRSPNFLNYHDYYHDDNNNTNQRK